MKIPLNRFPIQRTNRADEGQGRALRISCACGATEDFAFASRNQPPPESAVAYFGRRGWEVGAKASKDKCPACVEAERAARRAAKQEEKERRMAEEHKTVTLNVAVEPPRVMDRAARRRVFDAIEVHYPVLENGFIEGQTDEIISKRLDVPRAWVAQVREENFGPEFVIDLRAVNAERAEIARIIKGAEDGLLAMLGEADKRLRALDAKIDGIRAKIGK